MSFERDSGVEWQMRWKMDSGGNQDVEEDAVMNRSPNDYRRCQVGRLVMIIGIEKVDDDRVTVGGSS